MALPTTRLYRDSAGIVREALETDSMGTGGASAASTADLDTDGNLVPINRAHSYTYDGSGNLLTDTVSSADGMWTRTYTYRDGALATDSGWVKQ